MNKKILLLSVMIGLIRVNAQVTFPAGTNLCETTPWKLVWYDEFDGTSIDNSKWFTFLDDGNWGPNGVIVPPISQGSRTMNRGSNFTDANVVVSSGTCKLIAKYQPNTWINSTKLYTSGLIKARKNDANGNSTPMYFNKGKFEMRARISKAEKIWAAYWLWAGGNSSYGPGGSEIDMFEYMPINNSETSTNSFGFHGWDRGPGWPVSPDCTSDGNTFEMTNIDSWHIYSCEWDQNFVRLYIDGVLKFVKDRYKIQVGTAYMSTGVCTPSQGITYYNDPQVTATFPYPDEYLSFICSMDYRDNIGPGQPDRNFEIDYIRIYQRTPQPDLHDVCGAISGPTQICANNVNTTYTYTGDAIALGGTWQVSPNLSIVSSTNNSVTVKRTYATSDGATISIANPSVYCPSTSISIITGGPSAAASVQSTYTSGHYSNQLSIVNVAPNTTYNWSIRTATPNTWVSKTGANVSVVSNYTPLCFWVSGTNSCGTDYQEYGGCLLKPAPDDNNAPLIFQQNLNYTNGILSEEESLKAITYPNPVENVLNIVIGKDLIKYDNNLFLKITDINGKVLFKQSSVINKEGVINIDVSKYASGTYLITIQADSNVINEKFIKR